MWPEHGDKSFKFIRNRHRESSARSLSYFIFFLALIPSEIILLSVYFGLVFVSTNRIKGGYLPSHHYILGPCLAQHRHSLIH